MGKRILTALFILLPVFLLAQSKADLITNIKSMVKMINTDRSLKKVLLDNEDLAKLNKHETAYDGGEELTGCFVNDTLVKIIYSVGISTGMKTFEYYLQHSKVVFIYEQDDSYPYDEKQQRLNFNVLTNSFKGRYYLSNNKVFKKLENGVHTGERTEAFRLLKNAVPHYIKWLLKRYHQ